MSEALTFAKRKVKVMPNENICYRRCAGLCNVSCMSFFLFLGLSKDVCASILFWSRVSFMPVSLILRMARIFFVAPLLLSLHRKVRQV